MDYPGKVITKTQVTPTQTSASGNWTLDDQAAAIKNNNWPVALVPNPISKSLRFNSADSAYLNRTPASAGNRRTFTMNYWLKRAELGTRQVLASAGTGANAGHAIELQADNTLTIYATNTGAAITVTTTQVFRDPSAYGMLTIAFDTTQATASNRVKVYWNGTQITAFSTATYPSQNADLEFNNNVPHNIGRREISTTFYCGLYLTETIWVDGQALTPSDFGLTNPQTGQWIPKKYTGTYGINGFYLNFKDATSTTTLGYDYSGNANNWTTNNFSVTAGSGNDSLTDVPTPWVAYSTTGDVGGVVRGNYCTLNPNDKNSGITLTNGNLDASMPTQLQNVYGTLSVTSGKWYWETTINSLSGRVIIGVGNTVDQNWNLDPSSSSALWGYYSVNGNKLNGSNTAYGNSFTANDVIGVAVDMDSGKIWFSKNGTWQASGDPAAGTNAAFTNLSGSVRPMYNQQLTNAVTLSCNFGQRPFAYTPPAGFRSLCTTNLPATTIGFGLTNQANRYFDVLLYTGDGTTSKNVTGLEFQPDMVYVKNRSSGATDPTFSDVVRGITKVLYTDSTAGESTAPVFGYINSVLSNGINVNSGGSTEGNFNRNANTYVAWNWKAAGSTVTNTAGSITSTVSANTTAGFSIVTYTGTGANATVGHGLGVAPSMVIVKCRSVSGNQWAVWQSALSGTEYLLLETTNAKATATTIWNSTIPSSTVFSVGTANATNQSTATFVAYCFAAVSGYSAFGSYTGNGSADGPFVYLGFRPRFVMVKRTDSTGEWVMFDALRLGYNENRTYLRANNSAAEVTDAGGAGSWAIDFVSNGFKLKASSEPTVNPSGGTVIYAAFAESPFQFSNAR